MGKSGAGDELEVISVAPSDRAIWRLRRQTARASGRPQLAVRRVIAEAVASRKRPAIEENCENDGLRERLSAKRRRLRKQDAAASVTPQLPNETPQQISQKEVLQNSLRTSAKLSEDLQKARVELTQMAVQKSRCEGELAVERQRTKELNTCRQLKTQFEVQLAQERRQNVGLREKVTNQEWQVGELLAEKNRLLKRVQDLQRLSQPSTAAPSNPTTSNPNQKALAKQIAEMECRPLQNKSSQVRSALKKKLLVKWHPDKQPSDDHAAIATCVMQEIQNCPEWRR